MTCELLGWNVHPGESSCGSAYLQECDTNEVCTSVCHTEKTHAEAFSVCDDAGLRLCHPSEILSGVPGNLVFDGVGCGDGAAAKIWTDKPCGSNGSFKLTRMSTMASSCPVRFFFPLFFFVY